MRYAYPASWDPNPVPQKAASTLASVYGQVSHDFGKLVVTGSARHDDASSFGGLDIAQLSASLPAGDHWRFHASTGTGVKVPSLYQLYSDYGNPGLKPEKSQSLDGGVDYATASGLFGATLFTRQVRDQIDFASCYGVTSAICTTHPYGYYDNIARTKASGLELEGAQTLSDQWTIKGNYTFLTTRNESAALKGKRLPRTPDQMGSVDLAYAASAKLSLSLSVRYVGDSFDNAYNTTRLSDYTLADLRANYVLTSRVELYGRIENLTDAHYETAAGYGQIGRRVWLGVHTRLF
jgi:vitamin B12 transporter